LPRLRAETHFAGQAHRFALHNNGFLLAFTIIPVFTPKIPLESLMKNHSVSRIPEIALSFLAFFLNFFWEVVHTYFYTLKDSPFPTMLYGWLHCTVGDVMLTLIAFWIVSIMSRNRRWFLHLNKKNLIGFIMINVFLTGISERVNVYLLKSWSYNELMPIIPWLKVGLTPLFQWVVVPPVVVLLLRHHLLLKQEMAKRRKD
jgi:hypothetical protein